MLTEKHIHLESVPRTLLFPYILKSIGYISNNPALSEVSHVFPNKIEINLRLSRDHIDKRARMHLAGQEYVVSYPHVVVKKPNSAYVYHELNCRDVFYFSYSSSQVELLEQLGLFTPPLAWNISITPEVDQLMARLKNYLAVSRSFGSADRLDIICFQLLAELLLMKHQEKLPPDPERETIMRIDSYFRLHFMENISLEEIAGKYGLSRSAFFRHWCRYFPLPPAKHLLDLRLQEACRWLRESRLSINYIARQVNIREPAYFCAVFRKKYQLTPKQYRKSCLAMENHKA